MEGRRKGATIFLGHAGVVLPETFYLSVLGAVSHQKTENRAVRDKVMHASCPFNLFTMPNQKNGESGVRPEEGTILVVVREHVPRDGVSHRTA